MQRPVDSVKKHTDRVLPINRSHRSMVLRTVYLARRSLDKHMYLHQFVAVSKQNHL